MLYAQSSKIANVDSFVIMLKSGNNVVVVVAVVVFFFFGHVHYIFRLGTR